MHGREHSRFASAGTRGRLAGGGVAGWAGDSGRSNCALLVVGGGGAVGGGGGGPRLVRVLRAPVHTELSWRHRALFGHCNSRSF